MKFQILYVAKDILALSLTGIGGSFRRNAKGTKFHILAVQIIELRL